jgi:hypothetical protein
METDIQQGDIGGRDRRAHPRASLDLGVNVGRENMPVLPVTALNLSASGIYCVGRKSLGELTRVDLLLRVDAGHEIAARAVVIREEQLADGNYGIGMFFTSISDENRSFIAEIVARAFTRTDL